jgi:integrase
VPFFKNRDMREISEADLLRYIEAKLTEGLSPKTIKNHLSTLRRVYHLLQRDERVVRNPAARIGELMRRVERATATETAEVEYWTREEVAGLLAIAHETEPRFEPLLNVLFATGMRRGEALGLKWSDIDFEEGVIAIRRSITSTGLTTPKSGRSRRVAMPPGLASNLFDLLGRRRQECLARGWPEVPEWVFCSETGTQPDPRNVERVWGRVRRRAQKRGIRPLKLHCARHTWATLALYAGKSIRWVAEQLGHADPGFTLRGVRARDARRGNRPFLRGFWRGGRLQASLSVSSRRRRRRRTR